MQTSATVRSAVRSVMTMATIDDDGGDNGGTSGDGGIRNSQRIAFIGRMPRAPLTTHFEDACRDCNRLASGLLGVCTLAHLAAPQSCDSFR